MKLPFCLSLKVVRHAIVVISWIWLVSKGILLKKSNNSPEKVRATSFAFRTHASVLEMTKHLLTKNGSPLVCQVGLWFLSTRMSQHANPFVNFTLFWEAFIYKKQTLLFREYTSQFVYNVKSNCWVSFLRSCLYELSRGYNLNHNHAFHVQ